METMTPANLLDKVAKVIADRPISKSGRYVLYYRDGKVGIAPTPSTVERKYHIIRCDNATLDIGFTSALWNQIARRVVQIKYPSPCQGKLNDRSKKPD